MIPPKIIAFAKKLLLPKKELLVDMEALNKAEPVSPEGKKAVFCFSTGRSGTRWLSQIFGSHDNCHAGCERFPALEAFYRYVTWYGLPIDLSGFHALLEKAINYDWSRGEISINASPYFCFGVEDLVETYNPSHLIFMVRRPDAVVSSLYLKGWYAELPVYNDRSKIPGVQPEHADVFSRNFSRIFPKDGSFEWWVNLTPIGKVAWYCVTVVTAIYDAFGKIDGISKWVVKLEDIDQSFEYYKMMAESFGLKPIMCDKDYYELKGKMSNQGETRISYKDWSQRERKEYEDIIGPYQDIYDRIETTGL